MEEETTAEYIEVDAEGDKEETTGGKKTLEEKLDQLAQYVTLLSVQFQEMMMKTPTGTPAPTTPIPQPPTPKPEENTPI
eukprot:12922327-Prorocentrum_lima.AAC.1